MKLTAYAQGFPKRRNKNMKPIIIQSRTLTNGVCMW